VKDRRTRTFRLPYHPRKKQRPGGATVIGSKLPNLQAGRGAAVAFAFVRSLLKLRAMTFIIVRSLARVSLNSGTEFQISCLNPSRHRR
jgi:hypothetical protein